MIVRQAFQVRTIGGALLPVGGLLSSLVIFFVNGTYASVGTYAPTSPAPDVGHYSYDDATCAVTLYKPDGSTFATGVLTPAVLVLSAGGVEFVATPDGT